MHFWAAPMTLLGLFLWTLIFYQKIKPDKPKNNVLLALTSFALCVTINSPKIYIFLDNIVGSKNFVYLLVQLTFLAGIHFVWVTIQPETISLAKKISAFSSILIIIGFYFADMPYTVVRVEDFRNQLAVIFFTQVLNLHAGVVAVFVMKKIRIFLSKSTNFFTKFPLYSLFCGLGAGIVTVFVRIAIDLTATKNFSMHNFLVQVDGFLVFVLLILICGGLGLFSFQKKDSYNSAMLKITKLFKIKP